MAEQRFTGVFREALWTAHDEKCIYCGKQVAFMAMKVDHVIPERVNKDPVERSTILGQLNLPQTFDVLGYKNLAPSCDTCNSQKSDLPLGPGTLIVLAKVESRIPAIEGFIEKRRRERNLDNTLRHIVRSVEAGKFTPDELLQGLKVLRQFPDGIHGASPHAPPKSPEQAQGIWITGDRHLFFTLRAEQALGRLNLNPESLNDLIYRSVEGRKFNVARLMGGENRYVLRLSNARRLIFEKEGDAIRVLDIVDYASD